MRLAALIRMAICITIGMMPAVGSFAQQPYEFGKVSPADFAGSGLRVDSGLGGLVLEDIGGSYYKDDRNGWFRLVYTHYRKALIIDTRGYDLASEQILLYKPHKAKSAEKLKNLRACTYNLEDGKVVPTVMSGDAVFQDDMGKNHIVKKFTLPAVKPGSIIEYEYTIESDVINYLHAWDFQGKYPRVHSRYDVRIPQFFDFVFVTQGTGKFDVYNQSATQEVFSVDMGKIRGVARADYRDIDARVNLKTWEMKNVPPMPDEPLISSPLNYMTRIQFQFSGYDFPGFPPMGLFFNWYTVSADLKKSEIFGGPVFEESKWLREEVKLITDTAISDRSRARRIYSFVQKNFQNKGEGGVYLTRSLKEIYKSRSGYAQEINLLLTALLFHAEIDAGAVLLSTVPNGFMNTRYPILERLNYVVCMVSFPGDTVYLDASQPYLGFGKLPGYAYNGWARYIGSRSTYHVNMSPDSVHESRMTSVILFHEKDKPGSWTGNYQVKYDDIESAFIRKQIMGKSRSEYIRDFSEPFSGEYYLSEIELDDPDNPENPVALYSKLTYTPEPKGDFLYINPMLVNGLKENPFHRPERKYPIEFPLCMDDVYILRLQIPEGYVVEEIPRSEKFLLNEDEGIFEYLVTASPREITFRSRIKMNKAVFPADDYANIKDFFQQVLRKQSERIVLKKK